MAKLQVVTYNYTCDVGGEVIPESEADSATQRISWEGNDYVLDVCAAHAAELDGILTGLKAFVAAGTKSSGRRGRRPSVAAAAPAPRAGRGRRAGAAAASGAKRSDLSAVRAWARATGRAVSERGRIPAALLAAYDAAQNGSTSATADEPAASAAPAAAPRKRGGGRRPAAAKSSPRRANLGAVRSWARDNGYTVSERGRIPATLLAAYEAANNGASADSAPAAPRKRGGRRKAAASA